MDKLDKIFQMQAALNNYIIRERGLESITPDEWIQKHMIAMISEMGELLQEMNFKWWKNPKTVDPAALKEEMVDILHFFISMCLASGMTAEEMFSIYMAKNEENYLRQQGLSAKSGYELAKKDC